MKVLALTRGRQVPASRFRIRQCIPALEERGIRVVEHCPVVAQHVQLPGALGQVRRRYLAPIVLGQFVLNLAGRVPGLAVSRKYDLVWISRSFLPGLESAVSLLAGPRVLDVDDAIWMTTPGGERRAVDLARRVDAVLAGNEYIARWYAQYCPNVEIVPTAVDCDRFSPASGARESSVFTIGWMGTSGNFAQLAAIKPAIDRFLASGVRARLLVVADCAPSWWPSRDPQYVYEVWRADREVELMRAMDVGLMPLADTPWNRGKCSYKMLQAMACGLPVIVSPVGMNTDVLSSGRCGFAAESPDQWSESLAQLYEDEALRTSMGTVGRNVVEAHYSVPVVAARIADAFAEWTRGTTPG